MTRAYNTYRFLTRISTPLLEKLLQRRAAGGKEDQERLLERKGQTGLERPKGDVIWIHAASVGESQSALILVNKILSSLKNASVLVTTGTRTSAQIMDKNLPDGAVHQYYPLDHPDWVNAFIKHWSPTAVLWMESELWPNMMSALKKQKIPTALVNARLSDSSFRNWRFLKGTAKNILNTFHIVLCQNPIDKHRFETLGSPPYTVYITNNLKYSAAPLPCNTHELKHINAHILNRPIWLYSSTHDGEEDLACRVHAIVKNALPDLLTIIAPRHPHRRDDIAAVCKKHKLNATFRGENNAMPTSDTDIYIADTMGELGLFYRLAPLACIGRSFSLDGGGGHNPIEAAQLGCAVLHGPNVQFQQQIYDDMNTAGAALCMSSPEYLIETVRTFLSEDKFMRAQQKRGQDFAATKTAVIDHVWAYIAAMFSTAGLRVAPTTNAQQLKNTQPKRDEKRRVI